MIAVLGKIIRKVMRLGPLLTILAMFFSPFLLTWWMGAREHAKFKGTPYVNAHVTMERAAVNNRGDKWDTVHFVETWDGKRTAPDELGRFTVDAGWAPCGCNDWWAEQWRMCH